MLDQKYYRFGSQHLANDIAVPLLLAIERRVNLTLRALSYEVDGLNPLLILWCLFESFFS